MKLRLLLMFALVALTACTTDLKRGEEFYKHGNYDDAIASYERALQRDGDSSKARIGLRKSREAWLSQKLIEVRLARLSGDLKQAANELDQILANELAWKTFPRGAATFTQEEETEYAARATLTDVRGAMSGGKTLLAASLLDQHRAFFQATREASFKTFDATVKLQGQRDCTKLKMRIRPTDYYFGLFAQKFCTYFGAKPPELGAQAARESMNLFSDIDVVAENSAGAPTSEVVRQAVSEQFRKEFRSTPWFDAAGSGHLKFTLSSRFSSQHLVTPVVLKHSYTVSIPYTETHTEHRSSSTSSGSPDDGKFFSNVAMTLGAVGSVVRAVSGSASSSTSHSSARSSSIDRDEEVTVTETKSRSETRWIEYEANEHLQKFSIDVRSHASVGGQPLETALQQSYDHQSYENQIPQPEYSLSAQTPDLMADEDWIRSQVQLLAAKMRTDATAIWDRKFCQDSATGSSLSADRVFRCWHSRSTQLPAAFQSWFVGTFGVAPEEAERLLGVTT